jgi:hypothetical protein
MQIVWRKQPEYTVRTRCRFLWLPRSIRGRLRWLEKATWAEEWRNHWVDGVGPRWIAQFWLD